MHEVGVKEKIGSEPSLALSVFSVGTPVDFLGVVTDSLLPPTHTDPSCEMLPVSLRALRRCSSFPVCRTLCFSIALGGGPLQTDSHLTSLVRWCLGCRPTIALSYFTSFSLAHGVPCLLHLGSCHLPLFLCSMCWHPSDSGTTSSSFKTSLATSLHTFLRIPVTYVLCVCLIPVLYILFDLQ